MPKCDKCGSDLIEDNSGINESDLSEGQLADFEAGFWRVFYCPKCKVTETLEGDFGHIDNAIPDEWEDEERVEEQLLKITKAKRHQIKGDVIEYLAKQFFELQEYVVIKLVQSANMKWYLNENEIKNRFDAKRAKKCIRDIKRCCEKGSLSGVPDFLVVNLKDIFFVECKGVKSELRPNQKKVFEALEKKGYSVLVFTIDLEMGDIKFGEKPNIMKWKEKKRKNC